MVRSCICVRKEERRKKKGEGNESRQETAGETEKEIVRDGDRDRDK